ncbi:MAG TPA: FMN-binding negative transcriptional regulator [Noviherbaspirillum sp.]|jgi:transcriptional regulator|uniref:FMN-binding negative transcriptional regulator n=1 Tax=Noviherbaspirillum sp. TaxID=1926288 RepID=UPI002DDCBDDA|nr:FMN-binding negative transcriptional regulator [Noviherbaspirillum sp.]HEV2611605.1 FMN-binding negative transcriptional regulator [Noviherbaspirillum sp.]
MYMPPYFEEQRPDALRKLMREHPLGMLITLDPGGLNANPIPFLYDPAPTPFGTLRAHVARSNPVWKTFSPDVDALVLFQGPQAYISPSWYASKQEHGKVVPTWNYMVVQATGPLRVIDDAVWLQDLLGQLTEQHESRRQMPWKIGDAPEGYIAKLLGAIVGLEIPVAKLTGKWKVSQNRSDADRAGVARGLAELGGEDAAGMAAVVASWSGR